jgi:hypothetical protein
VIVQGLGRAEHGEQPIPEEIHNVPAVASHEAREHLEVVVEHRHDALRLELLRNGREAAQIAEECRHLAAVRGQARLPAAGRHFPHHLLGSVAREGAQARHAMTTSCSCRSLGLGPWTWARRL